VKFPQHPTNPRVGDKVTRLMTTFPVGIVLEVLDLNRVKVDFGRWTDIYETRNLNEET